MILASPAYFSGTGFFLFAVVISFLSTIVWIFVYLLSIREALPQIPIQWVLTVSNEGTLVCFSQLETSASSQGWCVLWAKMLIVLHGIRVLNC